MPTTFPEYDSFDGLGLANLIQQGVISPAELLEAAIERIELRNPKLNAVIHKTYDRANAAIQHKLPQGPFQGVPILLKDLLADEAGTPISFGSRYAYKNNWISQQDSELVTRLKRAGVVILGKTNVPEFGLSPVTEPVLYGPTTNPWNITRSSGGSSGGSAAAVAARMVPIAHGGDGGGSIRIPAAYTGLFGFKPTRGRTPAGPVFMRVWLGMVVEHALTRSVRDSAAMLDVLTGSEVGSPVALSKPSYSFLDQFKKPPRKLRIAMIEQPFFSASLDPEYAAALKKTARLCQDLGHCVEPASFVVDEEVSFAFLTIMMGETAGGLNELTKAIGRKPKSNELEKQTAMLCHAGNEFSAADYAQAIHILDRVSVQLETFFEKYDIILTPTMPFPAPLLGAFKLDRMENFGASLLRYLPYGPTLRQVVQQAAAKNFAFTAYTALFNIGGQPAMSVPLYWDEQGMPIGMQFAAKVGDDLTLLQLAGQLEEAQPWAERVPSV